MFLLACRIVLLLVLLTAGKCTGSTRRAATSKADSSGTNAPDVRRCALSTAPSGDAEDRAVACAEWFVARNGYTDASPADSAELAGEFIEYAPTVAKLLASRRNTLSRHAAVVCRGAPYGPGYTVGFAAPDTREVDEGRAVTMDSTFAGLKVEHQGYRLNVALADSAHCRRRR